MFMSLSHKLSAFIYSTEASYVLLTLLIVLIPSCKVSEAHMMLNFIAQVVVSYLMYTSFWENCPWLLYAYFPFFCALPITQLSFISSLVPVPCLWHRLMQSRCWVNTLPGEHTHCPFAREEAKEHGAFAQGHGFGENWCWKPPETVTAMRVSKLLH